MAYYNLIFEEYITCYRTESLLTTIAITNYIFVHFLIVTITIVNNIIYSFIEIIKDSFHYGHISRRWIASKLNHSRDSK